MESKATLFLRREMAVMRWIEEILEKDFEDKEHFHNALKDGVLLCKVMLILQPNSIPEINESSAIGFKVKQNINFFIEACIDIGVPRNSLFTIQDLWEIRDGLLLPERVINTLEMLAQLQDRKTHRRKNSERIIRKPMRGVTVSGGPQELQPKKVYDDKSQERTNYTIHTSNPSYPKTEYVSAPNVLGSRSQPITRPLPITPEKSSEEVTSYEQHRSPRSPSPRSPSSTTESNENPSNENLSNETPSNETILNAKMSTEPSIEISEESPAISEPPKKPNKPDFKRITMMIEKTPISSTRLELAKNIFLEQEQNEKKKELQRQARTPRDTSKENQEKAVIIIQKSFRTYMAQIAFRKRTRNAAYRKKVAQEILSTEKQYVENINLVVIIFLEPLEQMEQEGKGIISKEQIRGIFSDIKTILNFNKTLLEDLEPQVLNWSPYQCLGRIFLKIVDFLKVYTQYVKDYNVSLTTQNDLMKKNQKFLLFIKEKNKTPALNRADLASLLIMPIQRIPRYELLLKELVKHTWKDHPDYENLSNAAKKLGEVAKYVNQRKREAENIAKVYEIQSNFTGKFEDLAAPHRRFVREGLMDVSEKDSTKKSKKVVFLFNDLILLCKSTSSLMGSFLGKKEGVKVESKLLFRNASLIDENNKNQEFGIQIESEGVYATYRFYCDDLEQKRAWVEDLTRVLMELDLLRKQKDDIALKRAQAKAAETKSMITQQYATLRDEEGGKGRLTRTHHSDRNIRAIVA